MNILKFSFLLLFSFIFSFSVSAQNTFKKKNGKYVEKYPEGQVKTKGTLHNHKRNGNWIEYFPSGKIKSEMQYNDGTPNGFSISYFESGTKAKEINFTNGVQTGECKSWASNGQLIQVNHYDAEGRPIGLQQNWNDKGIPIERSFYYKNGLEERTQFSRYGNISNRMIIENNKKEGIQYTYLQSSSVSPADTFPIKTETYHFNQLEGPTKRFGKNHVLIAEYYYKNNLLDSVAREWTEERILKYEFHYKEGKLHGSCINYQNGKKFAEGNYIEGNPEGKHIQYQPELCYTWYSSGLMDSCRCYFPNNKLKTYFERIDPELHKLHATEYDSLGIKTKDWYILSEIYDGKMSNYWKNGKVKSVFEYKSNRITGDLKIYNVNGKLIVNALLDEDGNCEHPQVWSDAGAKLKQGTPVYAAQLKINLPVEFHFSDNGAISTQEEPQILDKGIDELPPSDKRNQEANNDNVFSFAEEMPYFPDLNGYLVKNLKYPSAEKQNRKQGTVYVSFIVEKDGSLSDIKIIKSVPNCPGFDTETIRVFSQMPNWKPGKIGGKEIRVRFNQQVAFKLN